MQRSGNNFMFGGGSKQNPQIIKNPTGPTNRQLFYMLKLYNNGKLNRKDIDPMK